jgi:hypothetical protein
MKVVCKTNNSKRLVKGAIYDVHRLENLTTLMRKVIPRIWVDINGSICSFSINNFKLESGDKFPEINWTSDYYKQILTEHTQTRIDNSIKKGDYVVYKRSSHKSLVANCKYKVADVREVTHKGYGSTNWTELEIQIEGSKRFYKRYSFRKCSVQEAREISLGEVLGEETGLAKSLGKDERKIDQYDDETKERMLTKILFSASLDPNRNNMTVVQWACNKTGSNLSLIEADFEPIINKSIKSIIEKWNN